MKGGHADQSALNRVGIDHRELALALSRLGVDKVSQVQSASLEPAGDVLFELKPGERAASRDDLAAAVAELKALIAKERG